MQTSHCATRNEHSSRFIILAKAAAIICLALGLASCGGGGGGALSSAKAITAYSLASVTGIINETDKTIAVTMPSGTNVTALVATFSTTGASVKVGATSQISGTTANNFTGPVSYTVTAADGSTVNYAVTVAVAVATVIDVSFTQTVVSGSPSVYTISNSFTLPTGFTNASLTIGSLHVDDRGVLMFNGTIISNGGIFGPGTGSMTLSPGGPNDPFVFTFGNGTQNIVITTGFLAGLNTLSLIVNDTNLGIQGVPLAVTNISGATVGATVSFD